MATKCLKLKCSHDNYNTYNMYNEVYWQTWNYKRIKGKFNKKTCTPSIIMRLGYLHTKKYTKIKKLYQKRYKISAFLNFSTNQIMSFIKYKYAAVPLYSKWIFICTINEIVVGCEQYVNTFDQLSWHIVWAPTQK